MRIANQTLVKSLRCNTTEAEKKLWRQLRNRQLASHKFRRQQPYGPYILDFYCAEAKLAIEVDGGQHGTPVGAKQDVQREAFLRREGRTVLRFWNFQVMQEFDVMVENIYRALKKQPLTRTLSPGGERDGEERSPATIEQQ